MTKQEKERMLARIYEVIANKELSFGCKILNDVGIEEKVIVNYGLNVIKGYCDVRTTGSLLKYDTEKSEFTVIGHPVMIGDFLKWMETSKPYKPDCTCGFDGELRKILGLWSKINLPIDEQSESTIDYIYSLIK